MKALLALLFALGFTVPSAPAQGGVDGAEPSQAERSADPLSAEDAGEDDPLAEFRPEAIQRLVLTAPGEGLARVVETAEEGELDLAQAMVEVLSTPRRFELLLDRERAALDYTRGRLLVLRTPALLDLAGPYAPLDETADEALDEARRAFLRAREGAGPGELRARAMMASATLDLFQAERAFRAFVTELAESESQPAPPVPAGPDGQAPDPIERAEALIETFRSVRNALVERVRLAFEDPDPRANLEWVQRRIRELEWIRDELEREQEQEQEQEQEEPQEGEDEQDSEGEDSESSDEQEPQPSEDSESQPDESEGSEQESPEGEDEQSREQETPEPGADEEGQEQAAPEQPPLTLSPEEIADLLNRLDELEEQAEQDRLRRLRRGRRAVERDW